MGGASGVDFLTCYTAGIVDKTLFLTGEIELGQANEKMTRHKKGPV